jgi:Tol biopolymer transport system component
MKPSGAGLRVSAGAYGPLWSPDGRRMALLNGRTVWLANGDGSHRQRIGEGSTGAWSPDGRLLAFDHGGRLYVVKRDGSGIRRLPVEIPKCPTCRSSEGDPAWSPDGRTLAFEHGEAEPGTKGVGAIWAADVDGRNVRRLSDWFSAYGPRWSPGGTKIAYLMDDGFADVSYLHIVNPDGSNDHRYRPATTFSWAPRGGMLAYESWASPKHVYLVRPGRAIVDLRQASAPAWAPNGNWIAFERRGSIYVADANGRRQRRVASGVQPSWSPDGRLIAYVGARCGAQQGIQLIRPNGTRHRRLTDFCFIVGTAGRDRIRGTAGTDRVLAGPGNDLVFVRDRRRDTVSCGAGSDHAIADQLDVLAGCERIER